MQDEALCLLYVLIALQLLDSLVDIGYFSLVGLEISVGLQIVEDGWHEIIPVASSAYLSAVGGKITYFWGTRFRLGILNDEYAKHFSFSDFFSPVITLR